METNKGIGFVLEKRGGSCVVQYEKGRETETVPIEMIVKEKDSDEIKYDPKQLKEIDSKRKERLRKQKT